MSKVIALGYAVVRGPLDEWKQFGTEVLGAQLVEDSDPTSIRFRTDDRSFRLVVEAGEPGPDALVALGLETASAEALDELTRALTENGIEYAEDAALARRRRVRQLITFHDPDGHRIEAHVAQETSSAPFVSPHAVRFVCGDMGLGHLFLNSEDAERAARFYRGVLGFRLSDTIDLGTGGSDAIFLRCNARHHSVAVATIPGLPPGVGHMMIEVDSLEQVGRALDRVQRNARPVQVSIGEHTNDRVTSFYVVSPSGFAIEYGFDGIQVDDDTWTVGHHDKPSVWGHHYDPTAVAGAASSSGSENR